MLNLLILEPNEQAPIRHSEYDLVLRKVLSYEVLKDRNGNADAVIESLTWGRR